MKFTEIFEKYWDNLIIGIIAGVVLYYGLEIKSGLRSALYIFLAGLFLVLIYTFFVWANKKYSLDKRFIEFFKNLKIKKFDKSLLVNSYLFILAIVIFASVAMLINEMKLLNPLLITLSILVSSGIVFLLVMIQKNPKEPLNNVSLLLIIVSIALILSLIIISIPQDQRGINLEPLEVRFNFYIVNNETNVDFLQDYIFESNKIWNKYNISIIAITIQNVEVNLTNEERAFLYTNISSAKCQEENKKDCDEVYMPLINLITKNNPNMSIIFIGGEGASGRGSLCGHSFAIFRYEKNSWIDVTGWNLAHEIGHILGLSDSSNIYKINLMNDKHKIFWKSSFLNQKDIETIVKVIKDKNQLINEVKN